MWGSWLAVMLGATSVTAQSAPQDTAYITITPPEVVEGAREYITQLLGSDIGTTCVVEAGKTRVYVFGGSGPVKVSTWELSARFRPRSGWDLDCGFYLVARNGQYSVWGRYGNYAGYTGQIPNCANYPELCDIQIDRATALSIARANGILPEDPKFNMELTLYLEPRIVWKVESRPAVEPFSRILFVDAISGDIVEMVEGNPCK